MGSTQNNLAAISSDESEEDGDIVFENPLIKIFRAFPNISNKTISMLRESNLSHRDLSALSDKDLQLFGISDATTRAEMIKQFSTSPNQNLHYDMFIEDMENMSYRETVYRNVRNHLRLMNMILKASQESLRAHPIKRDKLVTDSVVVSTLNTKAIKEILQTIGSMTKPTKPWNIWLTSIAGLTLLGTLIAFRKYLK